MWVVYHTCVSSAIATDFFRALGAKDYHIAIIGGVPMLMLSIYFLAAHLTNRLHRRRPTFMFLFITARLLFVPVAFLPMICPSLTVEQIMAAIIVLVTINCALSNFGETLFLSWMADLVPHRILNRYWGGRQRWMSLTHLLSIVAIAIFVHVAPWPVTTKFRLVVCIGVALGIIDILLFLRVDEPEHAVVIDRHPLSLLAEPFRHHEYRSFLTFMTCWSSSAIITGVFTTYYLLEVLELPLADVTLILALSSLGLMLTSKMWGRLADRHGHRPILMTCMAFKPLFPLAMLTITAKSAYWILPILLPFDGMLNAGLMVGQNGYMMKMAPKENRSMFLASVLGFPGIAAGLTAFGVGAFAKAIDGWTMDLAGRTWNKYQLIFAISAICRIGCLLLVRRIREPESSATNHMLRDLLQARPWGRKP